MNAPAQSNVIEFPSSREVNEQIARAFRGDNFPPRDPPVAHGGSGGDNGSMEPRVKALEDAMIQVRQDVAIMRSNYATQADIANAKTAIIMWVVGAIFVAQVLPALPGMFRAFGLIP